MEFIPLNVPKAFLEPLQYFFKVYASDDLKYDADGTKTKIEIGTVNDFHKTEIEHLPRILVDRGPITFHGRHLDEDLLDKKGPFDTKGLEDRKSHSYIQGQITIMIEARNEGTCEVLASMVSEFVYRTAHLIAREYGFSSLARPFTLGSCAPFEDGEKQTSFRVVAQIPYTAESAWKIFNSGIKIKDVDTKVSSSN